MINANNFFQSTLRNWLHKPTIPLYAWLKVFAAGAQPHSKQRITMHLEVPVTVQSRDLHGSGQFWVMTHSVCVKSKSLKKVNH